MFDFQRLIKYLTQGLAVALVSYYIPRKNVSLEEIAVISLSAAATFAILDTFTPEIAESARFGTGFGIGYNLTGLEGFEDKQNQEKQNQEQDKQKQQQDDDTTTDDQSEESDVTDSSQESDDQQTENGGEEEFQPQGTEPSIIGDSAQVDQVGNGLV